ncbi:MAG TPA: alpha-L-rhamnosidase C-terminal domain-containing protein, partial [Roseiflexaceae bacterium]
GPLLDHGVGFGFDCWQHCLETGDLDALRAPYPRLQRFVEYLEGLAGADGLLPVEGLGAPAVWIDHDAYRQQRHKQCAFNLYAAAMLRHALAPIARAFGDDDRADRYVNLSETIQSAATDRFWSAERGLFVDNLPWLDQDGAPALSDRALATAILYDQCPSGSTDAAVRALVECPPELGRSYPANAIWRYRALARLGRIDVVLDELRARWATMASVIQNNTIQEFWEARPDTADQWSHCAVAPIVLLFAGVAGIEPVEQGFARCRVRPQLGDLGRLELTAHTVRGPIRFRAERAGEGHQVALALPPDCAGELLLPERAQTDLRPIESRRQSELKAYQLAPGTEATCWMPGV